ncbi:MAG: GntR family transcriptional regulator [Candidatus Accumulibacter sp.]|jgi:DNA-binding GntR family transcriptional regulator|nr:GntR family transcriptional regulator [Accumulibacter sp.]
MIHELVTPLQRQTLSANVYEQLKDILMSGKMMPGQQLSLRSTADALNVSVMPVREATQRLVAENALEIGPSRMIRVPMMTESQFREITSIRINLEGFATEQACKHINEDYLADIETLDSAFDKELNQENPDSTKLISINKDLHFAIYKASEMPMLLQLIEALWLRIGPILNYDLRSGSKRLETRAIADHHTRLVKTLSHHSKLIKALKARDVEAAKAALHSDIETATEFIIFSGTLPAVDQTPP